MPRRNQKAFILSDIHIPYEDEGVVDAALKAIRHVKPDSIILNGDVLDVFPLSSFDKPLNMEYSMAAEIEAGNKFLDRLRRAAPNAKIDFVQGNHEERMDRIMAKMFTNPQMGWAAELVSIPAALKLKKRNIGWVKGVKGQGVVKWHDCKIGHWKISRNKAGYTANGLLERYAEKIVQGHTHHSAIVHRRFGDSFVWGIENPCMCPIVNVPYTADPNWAQGWTVLHSISGKVTPELCVVNQDNRTILCGGKVYKCGPAPKTNTPDITPRKK